jgi:dCMP deaminase
MNWKKEKLYQLLNVAEQIKPMSKDAKTQIAVLILDTEYTIRSVGYNSFPRGIDDSRPERQERPEKYFWFEHAERNSIYNAARTHADIRNSWMLLTCGMPCTDCARGIIQAGLEGIIMKEKSNSKTTTQTIWEEHALRSEQMFAEAGIKIVYLED